MGGGGKAGSAGAAGATGGQAGAAGKAGAAGGAAGRGTGGATATGGAAGKGTGGAGAKGGAGGAIGGNAGVSGANPLEWAQWPMPNGPADVAAGAPNPESYTDNGDGTVTDNVTGLMWQQAVPSTTYTWSAAVAFCPTLSLGGHNDWRLPREIELVSLIDDGASPTINAKAFPNAPAARLWSSTLLVNNLSSYAWYVDFSIGDVANGDVVGFTPMYAARCTR